MKLKSLFFVMTTVVMLSSCSSNNTSAELNYKESQITPTLEIPPDLISRDTAEKNRALPGSDVGTAANRGRFVETGNLNVEVRTLPVVTGMEIEGQGDLHWLAVPDPAEKVYPLIKEFWAEQGFRLLLDEPAIGVMETEWLSVKSGSESFFASIIERLRAAESKDQYKVRLERDSLTGGTDIYLVHRGQELILDDKEQATYTTVSLNGWQMMPADSSKEYAMLQRLMLFLGMQDEQVAEELGKIGLFAARASLVYDEDDEKHHLIVKQNFNQTWNRLKHQLDRASISPLSEKRGDNEGNLKLSSGAMLGVDSAELEEDQREINVLVEGSSNADQTEIQILNDNGTVNDSEVGSRVRQSLLQMLK